MKGMALTEWKILNESCDHPRTMCAGAYWVFVEREI